MIDLRDWKFWLISFIPHKPKTRLYDYEPYLREHLIKHKPKSILEFGTGKSTKIMHELCSDAKIISFEHSRKWYWKLKFTLPKMDIRLLKKEEYIKPIFGKNSFDFIFVDGIERTLCMKNCQNFLKNDGFLMLHDWKEWKIPDCYKIFYKKNNTALMMKK